MKTMIIGAGPGGYVAAIKAAQYGAEVTLVEENMVGGTCLNVGCIPTKTLLHTAEVYESVKKGKRFGIRAKAVEVDFSEAQKNKNQVVNRLVRGIQGLLGANKVKLIKGHASFVDAHTVLVETETEKQMFHPDNIIIATGSSPAKVPIPGSDLPCCIDSTGALELDHIPESLTIIGGGVIGVEMAAIYSTLGTEVSVIEMADEILPSMDREIVSVLKGILMKNGVNFFTSAKVLSIELVSGKAKTNVERKDNEEIHLISEKILISAGRKANTESLGLEKAEIQSEKGYICVDEYLETNVSDIYAIGDCIGGIMLAHTASYEAEIAVENAMGINKSCVEKVVPACVYTNPEFASVGITEEEAVRSGISYTVGRFPVMANGKCLTMGEIEGMTKVIADSATKKILGVHIFGLRATELIAECALAMSKGMTIYDIEECIHAHPTASEMIREAMLASDKRAIHMPN